LAQRRWVLSLDSFPYYTDTVASQQAYPPSYYSLPRYSTTLWNYSQVIKLWKPPVVEVEKITYIGTDGQPHDLFPGTDFIVDYVGENCRLFTLPGSFWPACFYTPNAVQIFFIAGYDPDPDKIVTINATSSVLSPPLALANPPLQQASVTLVVGIPQTTRTAIMMLACHWYFNREPVSAGSVGTVPYHIDALLASSTIFDFSPSRG
jgi:hypothetical protein